MRRGVTEVEPSTPQAEVLVRLLAAGKDGRLYRWRGGHWTTQMEPSPTLALLGAGVVMPWYVPTRTVRVMEKNGWLEPADSSLPWRGPRRLTTVGTAVATAEQGRRDMAAKNEQVKVALEKPAPSGNTYWLEEPTPAERTAIEASLKELEDALVLLDSAMKRCTEIGLQHHPRRLGAAYTAIVSQREALHETLRVGMRRAPAPYQVQMVRRFGTLASKVEKLGSPSKTAAQRHALVYQWIRSGAVDLKQSARLFAVVEHVNNTGELPERG